LIVTVSFMPIFTLEAQEGRLFSPLAFTKTFAMAAAAVLSVTLVPALMVLFVRGKIIPEHRNPINRFLIWIYRPVIKTVMRAKIAVILVALGILAITVWPARQLGTEFMPNLNEGTLLYMPTTLPGLSITKAAELLQMQDRIIRSFPEVDSVYGKAGRAATATDPAPTEMFETIINLKPKAEWRAGLTPEALTAEMDKALQFPGVSNAWTQPIKARIDMLSTGIRTPIGVKVIGTDLVEIDRLAKQVEQVLRAVPGTSSAYAERGIGGYYLDIVPDRAALARYGIMIQDVQDVIATALGGQTVTTTVEGRQRFSVNMRYPRDLRSGPASIARDVLVPMPAGGAVPLGEVAKIALRPRADLDPDRERPACGLRLCRHQGPRHRRLCRRRQACGERQHPVSARRLSDVERPVRISGTGGGAAQDRGAGDARDHLPPALSQFPLADGNADRDAVAAVRAGRRPLADVVARLQPVGRRRGRLHRAGRRRR
jgi:Cu(I)/Ag(I) efflux system membrane protein CusA/SilA